MKNQYTEDLLDRQRTINKWTERFIKNGKNLVLAVHAEWGMGKTFFAKQWYEYLKKLNYPICYIDAFENDFIDDPFKVITFSIVSQLKENKKIEEKLDKEIQDFENEGKNYLWEAAKLTGKHTVQSLLSLLPLIKADKTADELIKIYKEEVYKDPYAEDDSYKIHVKNFKEKLGKLVYNNKPLVVMVDELDRCKPSFAIELLEKLKHLYDVDNIIFVLFINEIELANIVKGYYGSELNGHEYLRKFIDIRAELPELNQEICRDFINEHTKVLINNFKYIDTSIDCIEELIKLFNFSLRDILQLINLAKYYDYNNDAYLFLYIAILKGFQMKDREIYNKLITMQNVDFSKYEEIAYKNVNNKQYTTLYIFISFYKKVLGEIYSNISYAEKMSKYHKEHQYNYSWTYEENYKYVLSILNMI